MTHSQGHFYYNNCQYDIKNWERKDEVIAKLVRYVFDSPIHLYVASFGEVPYKVPLIDPIYKLMGSSLRCKNVVFTQESAF